MEYDVSLKDRKPNIEYLRMALNMCELHINYQQADLITRVCEKLTELDGYFTVSDCVKIHDEWNDYWLNYFKSKDEHK